MTEPRTDKPLIVQGDHTILVEVASSLYEEARNQLLGFAELVKSPEYVHTYRMTPLSIWNARAAGLTADHILDVLASYSRFPLPDNVCVEVRDRAGRFGRLRLVKHDDGLLLQSDDPSISEQIQRFVSVRPLLGEERRGAFRVDPSVRGRLKQTLIKVGFPVDDRAGFAPGESLSIELLEQSEAGKPFHLREYQRQAADAFHASGTVEGGSGVIVLPCGAGKTIVGLAVMSKVGAHTLILTTSITAVRQWIAELIDKTSLTAEDIGEYTGSSKEIRPITVATYQMLTHRKSQAEGFTHLELFDRSEWGLIVYDEVHLLPAPIFQVTAALQARRRLGLTATLVREDGREDDVFALIGPKKVDVPWRVLEGQGWIAKATCIEIRIPMSAELRMTYATSEARGQFRVAAENPAKAAIVRELLQRHAGEQTLVLGMYVEQLRDLAKQLGIPVITGSTSVARRQKLFESFRAGGIPVLALSKVGNFAIDLPDASVAIQISGTFGSRQEEAQRLGRILRPKDGENQAHFYSLVSRDTVEQEFALNRQLFLCEQGYTYEILDADGSAP